MKKSTILLIFIIYFASIVAIGFFGMASKVYDEIKYVKTIEMDVEAEDDEMFTFQSTGTDSLGKKTYKLVVNFDKATIASFENKNGIEEERKFIPLTLIPHVTYDTGDVANAEEESIVYNVSNNKFVDKEYIKLSERGELYCFKRTISFKIYVNPASLSSNDAGVVIDVYII